MTTLTVHNVEDAIKERLEVIMQVSLPLQKNQGCPMSVEDVQIAAITI